MRNLTFAHWIAACSLVACSAEPDGGSTGWVPPTGGVTSATTTGTGTGTGSESGDSGGDGDSATTSPTTSGDGDSSTTSPTSGDGDSSTTGSSCGNGVIDPGEQCDGTNLGGMTCQSIGFNSGTLSCSGCNLDTSNCSSGTTTSPTTSGDGDGDGTVFLTTGDGDGDYVGPYSDCDFPDPTLVCDDLAEMGCIVLNDMATMTELGRVCYATCTPPSTAGCPTGIPPGGTAPISCQALVGTGECVLDCSLGQLCPTGMSCVNNLFCGWVP